MSLLGQQSLLILQALSDDSNKVMVLNRTRYRQNEISRRRFLAGAAVWAAGSVLAACGSPRSAAVPTPGWRTPAPLDALPSPLPAATPGPVSTPPPGGTPAPTSEPIEPELAHFLALSSALTGFEKLSPQLGRVYLASVRADSGGALETLYGQAGPEVPSLDELERAGVFANEATRTLAGTIATYWYTGVYDNGGRQTVATSVDALAWKAIYTKPNTICGPFSGFWQEPADQEIRD